MAMFSEQSSLTLSWEGVVVAQTPIVVGGEKLGNVSYLRREKCVPDFRCPKPEVVDVPVVSGNAVRGVLRECAADMWWVDAGEPTMTTAVEYAVWAGGVLTKSTRGVVSGRKLTELKEVCLPVAVFGAAGGGRMIAGKVRVGRLTPIVTETYQLLPSAVQNSFESGSLLSLWDITQLDWYNRQGDAMGDHGMRFGVESFLPGVPFHFSLHASWLTVKEADFVCDVVERYQGQGFHVGAMKRLGYGTLGGWESVRRVSSAKGYVPEGTWKREGSPLTMDECAVLARLD